MAIDLGTSAVKVALVTVEGEVVALETEETALFVLPDGGAEQDPEDWWRAIKVATGRLMARGLIPPQAIIAVSCTAQWSGTVPVDRQGRALGRAIIWMDTRGAPYVRQITGGLFSVSGYGLRRLWQWIRKTGGVPAHSGKDSLAHILFLKRERPDLYGAAFKFLEPKDYLNLRLTGQFAASYDSITLHWLTDNRNPQAIHYDQELLRLAGVEEEKLPPLRAATDILGSLRAEAAEELGLPSGLPVVMGTPDVLSATLGSGAVADYQAHLYVGTSSWLTCHVPFKKTDLWQNMASLPAAVPGRYFVANEQETAGAALTFLRDNILYFGRGGDVAEKRDAYRLFDRLAGEAPPGSGGVIFTPWLYGERTPVENHLLRAGFYNLSLRTDLPQLVRAVLEGVAFNTRWLLEAVEKFVGRRLDPIRFIGGGARSEIWSQIFADVLDRTIEGVEAPVEANVRGAAFLAVVALGLGDFSDLSRRVRIAQTFRPRAETRAIYDELFWAYRQIYRLNRGLYARLNRSPGNKGGAPRLQTR